MKKLIAFFLVLFATVSLINSAYAGFNQDDEGNQITTASSKDTPSNPIVLSASWKMRGDTCNVYVIAGNASLKLSDDCVGGVILKGVIESVDGRGKHTIQPGGFYRFCIGSDASPPVEELCQFEEAAGKEPASQQNGTNTTPKRPDPIFPADRNVPEAVGKVFGLIQPPEFIDKIGFGSYGINKVLGIILDLVYVVAGIIFLFMVVASALQWITSGGDKEAVASARKRLTHAIIGMVLLALAAVIITTLGKLVGFSFYLP